MCAVITGSFLGVGDAVQLQRAQLRLSAAGELVMESDNSSDALRVDLGDREGLLVADLGDWFCAVPERLGYIVIGSLREVARLSVIKPIPRLELQGYDPGGLERVGFISSSSGLLVETEAGVVLVSPDGGISWRLQHDDLTARVVAHGQDFVELRGESGTWRLAFPS